jgi:hypothetical protein
MGKQFLEKIGVSLVGPSKAVDHNILVLGPDGINQDFELPLSDVHIPRRVHVKDSIPNLRELSCVLAFGLNQDELKTAFPDISTKNAEHISTYFEPFRVTSPLRGIGPADLHNRDPKEYPLVTAGAEVVGNGILAVADDGRTVICGMSPWQFPADKQSFKRTFRRSAFTLARLLGNMNVDMQTPLPGRFHGPVSENETRWLDGLYLDQPEEWDDSYRFFRW